MKAIREQIIGSLRSCAKNESCAKRCVYEKESVDYKTGKSCLDMLMDQAADMLEQDAHFAGVGKMVYCKDCAHLEYEDLGIYYCGLHRIAGQLNPDDYCSRATAREEANE